MALRRGPFELQWNGNIISDVESIDTNVDIDSDDYTTLDARTYTIEGAIKASVNLTLLRSDLPTLAALLPQYFVANGAKLSTGETVNNANGAIDVVAASCDKNPVYGNLDIISCGNPGDVIRLVHARTKIDSMDVDDKIAKVTVSFVGEPGPGQANLQFFTEGTIHTVS